MTRREVIAAMKECEEKGTFDVHVDPIPEEIVIPVTEDYHYPNKRTFFEKIKYAFEKIFVVKPFTLYQNKCCLKTEVIGRENLKGLTAAVLTCNHVAKFDCLAVKYGARGHRTYVVAAPFNNMKGFLGEMMRAGDMLPMNKTVHGTAAFNKMVEEVITVKKSFLLVYPEASMWWHYKKPRPYKEGAFYIAEKYRVPVVPQFITYRDSGKKDEEGLPIPYFTLHIMPPIYPKDNLSKRENIEYLKNSTFDACRKVYEDTYGKKLSYGSDDV
ncbi:MAG: lysophospholipid acyltransferase family protein [Eubacteriales bacterium]